MAEFEIGSFVDLIDTGDLAIVVAKTNSTQGSVRTLAPNPADDVPIGPNGSWSTSQSLVTINDTLNPGTATLNVQSRLVQDLRDNNRHWPVQGFISQQWNRNSPTGDSFTTASPVEDLWLEMTTLSDLTDVSFEVKTNLGSTVTVQVYKREGITVYGPDAAYADQIRQWSWTSANNDINWQSHTIVIGSVYPGALARRTYYLRVTSGPNLPGLQLFQFRRPTALAAPITV